MVLEKFGLPAEAEVLKYFSPELSGRLGVALFSFFGFFMLWLSLSKRKVSNRIMKVVETKLKKTTDEKGLKPIGPSIGIEQVELATRVVGIVHALVVSVIGWIYLRQRLEAGDSFSTPLTLILDPTGTAQVTGEVPHMHEQFIFWCSWSLGFWIGDVMLVLVLYELYGTAFLFHAACGISGITWPLIRGAMQDQLSCKYVAIACLTEASTPWLNLFFLVKGYYPDWSRLQLLIGLIMMIVFFVVRILMLYSMSEPMLTEVSTAYENGTLYKAEQNAMRIWVIGLMALNGVWFYKMFTGFIRKLFPSTKSKTN